MEKVSKQAALLQPHVFADKGHTKGEGNAEIEQNEEVGAACMHQEAKCEAAHESANTEASLSEACNDAASKTEVQPPEAAGVMKKGPQGRFAGFSGKNAPSNDLLEDKLEIKVGAQCIAYDERDDKWYKSKILQVNGNSAKIHYDGWGSKFDIWWLLPLPLPLLSPCC